ncbi:MAG: ankyrin repeat domain-containing protein [Bacilli bacterium]|nr:ankyrin repeat domain-containing protein [Bacilli bacterium]
MFYDEERALLACEEDPSLVFQLIREGHFEAVDKLLSKHKIDINVCDENGNDILVRLLKKGQYELVLKHMKNKDWDVNHQNHDGNTFAHILVLINYINVLEIIKQLKKNKKFLPNIKNNKGETILDKSINGNYIYTTVKILEDRRFNSIDIASFKKIYDTYIKTNKYGKYTKMTNLEIIMDSLDGKDLVPRMEKLVGYFNQDYDYIKDEIINDNKTNKMDGIINKVIRESNV